MRKVFVSFAIALALVLPLFASLPGGVGMEGGVKPGPTADVTTVNSFCYDYQNGIITGEFEDLVGNEGWTLYWTDHTNIKPIYRGNPADSLNWIYIGVPNFLMAVNWDLATLYPDPAGWLLGSQLTIFQENATGYGAFTYSNFVNTHPYTMPNIRLQKMPVPTATINDIDIDLTWPEFHQFDDLGNPLPAVDAQLAGYMVYRSTTNATWNDNPAMGPVSGSPSDWVLVGGTVNSPIVGTSWTDTGILTDSGNTYYYSIKPVVSGQADNVDFKYGGWGSNGILDGVPPDIWINPISFDFDDVIQTDSSNLTVGNVGLGTLDYNLSVSYYIPNVIFGDNFDGEVEGTNPPLNWVESAIYPPQNCEVDDIHSNSSPKSMWLRSTGGESGTVHHDVSFYSELYQSMLYFDSTNERRNIVTQAVPGDLVGSQYCVYMQFDELGRIRYYDGAWQLTGFSYSTGWHKLEIAHDLANNTFDAWYDGIQILDNCDFWNSGKTSIESVHFWATPGDVDLWIDDVQIGSYVSVDWLSVSPENGTLPSSASTNHTVTVNTTGLNYGTYKANITIESNDPDETIIVVPVNLTIRSPIFVQAYKTGGNVRLEWSGGSPPFEIFISNNVNGSGFNFATPNATISNFWWEHIGVLGDGNDYSYIVRSEGSSINSNIAWKFACLIQQPGAPNINWVSLPYVRQYERLFDVGHTIDYDGDITREIRVWSAAEQNWKLILWIDIIGQWFGDTEYVLSPGGAILVFCSQAPGVCDIVGSHDPTLALNIQQPGAPNINWVSLPYHHNYTTLGDVGPSVGDNISWEIRCWDLANQQPKVILYNDILGQWLGDTTYALSPGDPVMIFCSQAPGTWYPDTNPIGP